jgi:hypothetical protein
MRAPVSHLLAVAVLLAGTPAWAGTGLGSGPSQGSLGGAQLQQHNEMMKRQATWRQRLMERLRALWARRPFQGKQAMEEMKKQREKAAELVKGAKERMGLGGAGADHTALSPMQRLERTRNGQPPRTPWTVTGGFGKFVRRAGSDVRMDQDSPVERRNLIARVTSRIKTMAQSFRRKLGRVDQAPRALQPAAHAPSAGLARRPPGVFRRVWERVTGRANGYGTVRRSLIRKMSARLDGAAGADLIKLRSLPDETRRAELLRKADRLRQQGYRDMATIFETVATFRASDFEKLCLAFLVRRNREEFERGTARTRKDLREHRLGVKRGSGEARSPRFRLVQVSQ